MHTFDLSADALLHCYIVDEKSNDGLKHTFVPLNKYLTFVYFPFFSYFASAILNMPYSPGFAAAGYEPFNNNTGYEMNNTGYAAPVNS